jgi:hypothetical protein
MITEEDGDIPGATTTVGIITMVGITGIPGIIT